MARVGFAPEHVICSDVPVPLWAATAAAGHHRVFSSLVVSEDQYAASITEASAKQPYLWVYPLFDVHERGVKVGMQEERELLTQVKVGLVCDGGSVSHFAEASGQWHRLLASLSQRVMNNIEVEEVFQCIGLRRSLLTCENAVTESDVTAREHGPSLSSSSFHLDICVV